jgi:hypothetical protein
MAEWTGTSRLSSFEGSPLPPVLQVQFDYDKGRNVCRKWQGRL